MSRQQQRQLHQLQQKQLQRQLQKVTQRQLQRQLQSHQEQARREQSISGHSQTKFQRWLTSSLKLILISLTQLIQQSSLQQMVLISQLLTRLLQQVVQMLLISTVQRKLSFLSIHRAICLHSQLLTKILVSTYRQRSTQHRLLLTQLISEQTTTVR